MAKRKLRYGLIGAGSNAEKKHLNNYMNLPHVEIVAICDVNINNARKLANKCQITKVYTSYVEMILTENLDLVSICTPNSIHAEIAVYALLNGVNVHCEKPLAVNAVEAQKIVDAKNQSGKKVMVGLNNRFTNQAVYLKKYIDAGYLGTIYQAKAGWVRRSGIPGRGTWFTNKSLAGGGVMIDLGVHYLDLALYLMGMPEPSYITGSIHQNFDQTTTRNRNGYKGDPHGIFNVEDSATGFIGLQEGGTVHFEFSWASNIEKDQTYIEILGTKGGAVIRNGELKIYSEMLDTCVDIVPDLNSAYPIMNEFEHFTNSILYNNDLLAPAEHGVYMMNIIDHFYQSANNCAPAFFQKNKTTLSLLSNC
ncbi:Gfo/Idh/MocA family oxidoreductase [Priestia aryabhattai]|uniref:Gfo/Idh/MocA family protein n=1 Tax=Priestia aryabhattai TaxID=412384 RepID=UPI0028815707|nr:Gfo/Idh/MocA family oxidoreductase [Priestia aryabhattai]MDT0145589.1 Gfo/Idh/MocA family oxidoreductase [Priestia aryabhattai]MDT0151255.1 Gfo/Idh/MocA family oxidoreductase [Priestia aryabhattai]